MRHGSRGQEKPHLRRRKRFGENGRAGRFGLLAAVLAGAAWGASGAGAQRLDPTAGRGQFPQFRHLSALSGAGYGVDFQGYASLSGPIAYATPIAPVLGHGQFRVGIDRTSFRARPTRSLSASNGTAFFGAGFTVGPLNIYAADMFLSVSGDQAFNLQAQYVLKENAPWAFSIGVQDIGGGGGAAGQSVAGDALSSHSVFAVATYRVEMGRAPLYLTAGIGSRRFRRGFASASLQILPPMRGWIEHDGYGVNLGLLFSWRPDRRRRAEVNFHVGLVKARYFTIGGGFGF